MNIPPNERRTRRVFALAMTPTAAALLHGTDVPLNPRQMQFAAMGREVQIDGELADDISRSVVQEQVKMGVAVRMACMDLLARNLRAERGRAAVGVMV